MLGFGFEGTSLLEERKVDFNIVLYVKTMLNKNMNKVNALYARIAPFKV